MAVPNEALPSAGSTCDYGSPDRVRPTITTEYVRRVQELHDQYDAPRAYFPDDEFYDAWDPIIEPLLWALPEERDPALLEHVARMAPSSRLWSTVQRLLDYREPADAEQRS